MTLGSTSCATCSRDRVVLFAETHAARLEQYVQLHEQAVRSLTDGVERRGEWSPEQIARLVATERQEFPGFAAVVVTDARGRVVVASPEDAAGLETFSASGLRRAVQTGESLLSAPAAGPGPGPPYIGIVHPILLGDTLAGFAVGALDLTVLPRARPDPGPRERLMAADATGSVVFDSRAPYAAGDRPRSLADSLAFSAVSAVQGVGSITYLPDPSAAAAAREAGRHLAGVAHLPQLEWWVWVEQPFAMVQAMVSASYVRLLGLLIAVTLLALAFSDLLTRALSLPLLRIRAATGALAAGDRGARVGRLAASTPTEIAELGRDFDSMADALVERTEELEELGEIARALASTLDPDEVLRQVTDAAVRLVRADGGGIALLTYGGRTLQAGYSVGLLAGIEGREFRADESLVAAVATGGEALLIADAGADPQVKASYLDPASTGSLVCAPLQGRSGRLGTLTAVRGRGRAPFSLADLRLVERLSRQAAVAVENAHLVARERQRAEESEAIRRIARTVSEVQGLEETLAAVAREAADIVGAAGCRVLLLRPAPEHGDGEREDAGEPALEVVAVAGRTPHPVGTRLPVQGPLLEEPLHHGRPATVSDGGYASAVPLRVGDDTLGVLTAHRESAPFGPEDAGLLAAFADHAAVALRNAGLLDAAQAASRAKSDFIATMSHELRTPLNAVLGHLELLEMEIHGPLTAASAGAGRIEAATRHLRGLIEEVLSFAQLEAGRVPRCAPRRPTSAASRARWPR
jgi:GAF domain-containing protein